MQHIFTKMQGLGNDFVVIDATREPFKLNVAEIQQLANRRYGIGFDQLLVVEASQSDECDFHFRIFNADGSEVGQCGNGARCIARFIAEKGLSSKATLRVSTIEGELTLRLTSDDKVAVEMGVPRFKLAEIPFVGVQDGLYQELIVDHQKVKFGVVNIGNPHAIIPVENIDTQHTAHLGPLISNHASFPEGTNVGFMQVIDKNNIRLRVYERGAGETLACGSGACAAMVLGRRWGMLQERVVVSQLGGSLTIDWQGPEKKVIMKGPAIIVFEGHWH